MVSGLMTVMMPRVQKASRVRNVHVGTRTLSSSCVRGVRMRCSRGDTGEASVSSSESKRLVYTSLGLLGVAGCVDTAYLLAVKLSASPLACGPTAGCTSVLESRYASIDIAGASGSFSVPLPLLGFACYATLTALALRAATRNSDEERAKLLPLLAAVSATLSGSSLYLVSVLLFELHASCPYCMLSAGLSFTSAALVLWLASSSSSSSSVASDDTDGEENSMQEQSSAQHPGDAVRATMAAGLASSTLILAAAQAAGGGDVDTQGASSSPVLGASLRQFASGLKTRLFPEPLDIEYSAPVITTESSELAMSVARRLRDTGSAMYGAFWCSHCNEQKELFGQQAVEQLLPYVECYPQGYHSGKGFNKACSEANIKAYPTWRIGANTVHAGELTLEELDAMLDEESQRRD